VCELTSNPWDVLESDFPALHSSTCALHCGISGIGTWCRRSRNLMIRIYWLGICVGEKIHAGEEPVLFEAIRRRRTNRQAFERREVPAEILAAQLMRSSAF
jgi:hypothetical protein